MIPMHKKAISNVRAAFQLQSNVLNFKSEIWFYNYLFQTIGDLFWFSAIGWSSLNFAVAVVYLYFSEVTNVLPWQKGRGWHYNNHVLNLILGNKYVTINKLQVLPWTKYGFFFQIKGAIFSKLLMYTGPNEEGHWNILFVESFAVYFNLRMVFTIVLELMVI